VLRSLILMRVKSWDYRELRERIADGYTLRQFTGFHCRPVPGHNAFHRAFVRLTPATLRAVNDLVAAAAVDLGLEDGTKLRVDTTVVQTDIHYPTDSTLLWDAVRVLSRLLDRLGKLHERRVEGFRNRTRAARRRMQALQRMSATQRLGQQTAKYRELGTAANLLMLNRLGALPTRNFQAGTFQQAESLSPQDLGDRYPRVRSSCVACTIGCEHLYDVGGTGVRVEYESLFALGSLCGVADGGAVLRASRRCDELGLDTISTGGTIAFAMECVQRGLLAEDWLTFGSGDAMMKAIELIGAREGIGQLLAEGSRRTALAIGHGSIAFAPQVKGLEIPGYEPRALQTMALGFAVGARGADHNRSGAYEVDLSDKVDRRHATRDSVRHAIETEDRAALMDSLIVCKFLRGVFDDFYSEAAIMLRAVTGWDVTAGELHETARRIVGAKREFNLLAGWTPEEDTLPERFLDTPLPGDPAAILTTDMLQQLVAEYRRARGWSAESRREQ